VRMKGGAPHSKPVRMKGAHTPNRYA
jgi:hypothetical protein